MTQPSTDPHEDDKQSALALVYNLKIQRVALILVPLAIAMMVISQVLGETPREEGRGVFIRLLHYVPFMSLGEAFLTIAFVGLTFEWIVRREADAKVRDWVGRALEEQRRTIATEAASAVLVDPHRAVHSLSVERIQKLLKTCLAAELHDEELAQDIYNRILRPAARVDDRWSRLRQRITLGKVDKEWPEEIRSRYYQAHLLARYRCVLKRTELRYLVTMRIDEYEESLNDDQYIHRWLYPPTAEFQQLSTDCHQVSCIKVNNIDLHIRRETTDKGGIVSVGTSPILLDLRNQVVEIEFQCDLKQPKRSHTIYLGVPTPTKDVTMEIDFSGTDIWYMSVFQYFSAQGNVNIRHLPTPTKPHRIEVQVDEWVLPAGGVVFTWVLQEERTKTYESMLREFTLGVQSTGDRVGDGHGPGPFLPIDV